jgi:hypothetical protein
MKVLSLIIIFLLIFSIGFSIYDITCRQVSDKYKFCSDGYIKFINGYKIVHISTLKYWENSNNQALVIQSKNWADIVYGKGRTS